MTTVNFYSIPFLDSNYEHVIDFENSTSRNSWFQERVLFSTDVNIKNDTMRTSIVVKEKYGKINNYDYLSFYSEDNFHYFYFINSIEILNRNTSILDITLDVFTTYNNFIGIRESFVDRCHVARWNNGIPYASLQEENLEMGDIIQLGEPEKIADFEDTVIVVSTVPIGKLPNVGGGGGTGGSGCWEEGKVSGGCFRFLKGFEGFAPYAYQDSGGYWTIAYGVTLHGEPDIYNELKAKEPVPEQDGAMVLFDLLTQRYGQPIVSAVQSLGATTQSQFDALCSLAYNSGTGSITGTNSLTLAIRENPNDEATIRPVWESFKITSGGVQLPGLVARRKEECNMYFGQTFETRPIALLNSSGAIIGNITENNGDGWLPTTTC